eukprot:Rhum_TRINITY_DN14798_c10_g1::Rhum_TRINITY_DN14798_c10_g1_i1::g.111029::m.111029
MALRSTKALHYYHKQRPLRANFFRNNFHRSEEVRLAEIGAREMIDNHGSQEQQHNSEFTYFMRRTSVYYSHFPWVSACVFVVAALKMAFMMRPEIIPSLPFFLQPCAHKEYGIRNGAQSPISSGGMMNWDDEIGDSAAGEVSSKSGNHAAYSKMSIERCVLRFDRFDAAKERRTDILNGVDNEVEAMRKIAA